jgi:hypothetical protein
MVVDYQIAGIRKRFYGDARERRRKPGRILIEAVSQTADRIGVARASNHRLL